MKKPLDIAHMDISGPTRTKRLNRKKYFMLLVDDYTRKTAI